MANRRKVLLADLNNFARYPTVSIGYLAAILRRAGMDVSVFSPLSIGVTGVVRETPVRPWGLWEQRARHWSATTRLPAVRRLRALAHRHLALPKLARDAEEVVEQFRHRITANEFDAVLVSTYLMYFDVCERIGAVCAEHSLPMVIGGSYFAQPEVRKQWCSINGLSALVGGEVELQLPEIVERVVNSESLNEIPGVWSPGRWNGAEAAPLAAIDRLPFPDYRDFPWDRYPERIVPVITGRGCRWGACTFCSDVTSTAGRSFRSRSPESVCDELAFHHTEHGARLFVFTDLKMNSDLQLWNTLLDRFQTVAPGSRWVGAVHVDAHRDNGLTADDLRRAADAGMVRLTTGLESGSQRVLDLMKKGTDLALSAEFLGNAAGAGISVRVTTIVGYPGETADDVRQTAEFLQRHSESIERVLVNRFQIMSGTRFHRSLDRNPERYPDVLQVTENHRMAQLDHHFSGTDQPGYKRALRNVLRAAHEINRQPLRDAAAAFDGVM